MAPIEIPDGFELVSGRSKENAIAALALAEERGLDPQTVQVSSHLDGYLVPLGDSQAAEDAVPDEKSTVAEIEAYAEAHGIELPADGKKADKLQAVLDAVPAAEQTAAETETSGDSAGAEADQKGE